MLTNRKQGVYWYCKEIGKQRLVHMGGPFPIYGRLTAQCSEAFNSNKEIYVERISRTSVS